MAIKEVMYHLEFITNLHVSLESCYGDSQKNQGPNLRDEPTFSYTLKNADSGTLEGKALAPGVAKGDNRTMELFVSF